MSDPLSVKVEGIPEVNRALRKVGNMDVQEAGTEAANRLIPHVQQYTRVDTSRLQSGWDAQQSALINEVPYAVYEEYGTQYIDGMEAIRKAVDQREDVVVKAFEDEAERVGKQAGLGS